MEYKDKKQKRSVIRANVLPAITPAIVVSIVAVIVSVMSLATSVYDDHYNRYGVQASTELKCDYKKNGNNVASGSFKPTKGSLEFGYFQTKGNSKCRYSFYYKKNSASSYKVIRKNYRATKNNNYYGSYKIAKVNGRTSYDFKNVKVAGNSKASILFLDLAIL